MAMKTIGETENKEELSMTEIKIKTERVFNLIDWFRVCHFFILFLLFQYKRRLSNVTPNYLQT